MYAIERGENLETYHYTGLSETREWLVGLVETNSSETLLGYMAHMSFDVNSVEESAHIPNSYIVEFSDEVSAYTVSEQLQNIESVNFAVPLVPQEVSKDFIPNDEFFNLQWHLQNTGSLGGKAGADANVVSAWDSVKGRGVVIGIVDDGIDIHHEDLNDNYRGDLSWDFQQNNSDPSPNSSQDTHGTSVAGIAAAEGNNGIGVSGAAPEAEIAGLQLLGSQGTNDNDKANALSYQNQEIDIYQNSWSPGLNKNPIDLFAPGPSTTSELESGVELGRDGLGNIYVFSAGNNREQKFNTNGELTHYGFDNVNNNGYANSRFTIAVGAIDDRGVHSSYSEPGAALFVSAYSSGNRRQNAVSTDLSGAAGSNYLKEWNWADTEDYTFFGGTSSAAPLVSGVVALMLETNPQLTWRDVQHIIAKTARKTDPTHSDWSVNGAGYNINHFYGFGAIDAVAAVEAAKTWDTVDSEVSHTTGTMPVNRSIPDNRSSGISQIVDIPQDIKLESVEVVFDATHPNRGDLEIVLVSPSGTESILAEPRPDSGDNYDRWVFNTVRNWGESSKGTWKLQVSDKSGNYVGTWDSWELNFYGTEPEPVKSKISVSVKDASAEERKASETQNPAVFTLTREGDLSQAETVSYSLGGSADSADYGYLSGLATFEPGQASIDIKVMPIDDSRYEGNETITFSLNGSSDYELGTVTAGQATIYDNDPPPISQISVELTNGVAHETESWETSQPAIFTVKRSGGDNSKAENVYYTVSGTADNGIDYSVVSGVATIPAGSDRTTVKIQPINDSKYEGTETVSLQVTANPNYKLGATTNGTASIEDNDFPPSVIRVLVLDADASENSDPGRFLVSRSGGDNSKEETVYYTLKGSAINGEDYASRSGFVTFPAGSSMVAVSINPIDDATIESTENVTFEVTQHRNYTLSESVQGEITIWDNDKPELNYQAQSFWEFDGEWSDQMSDRSSGSAVDAEGNFYVVLGYYNDPKVQKVSPSGDLLWEKKIDQPICVKHVAVKNNSLIIHSSDFSSGSRFSEISLDTGNGGLIYTETQVDRFAINPDEYDSVPTALKDKAMEVYNSLLETADYPYGHWANEPIQDSEGNVYVTGAVDYNEYLIKVNANGSHAWTFKGEIADGFIFGSDVEFASDGSIYFLSYGNKSDLLTKLSSSGKVLWQSDIKEELQHHSDSYHFHVLDMALDAEDKVHLFGGRTNPVPHYDTGNYWTAVYAPVEQNSSGTSGSDPISSGGKSHAFGVSWTGELTRINLETGVSESLGSTGFSNLNSLTSDGQGKLLTIANVNSSVGEIIQIDPSDGTSRVVSTFNNNFGGVKASIRGLTRAADGSLYAIHNSSYDELFRIDPQTGTASEIATLDRSSLQSLAMAPSGKLYSIDMSDGALIEINPNTGSSKTIGAKGGFLNIQGLAFDDNGILYATGQPNSYTVDLQTGALTPVPELGTFRGLAFVSESQLASSSGTSNATTLYDITFDESSQALGEQPLANDSSNTVSRVVFGDPTVKQSSGRLGNRPLVFTDDQSGYDQVQLDVGAGFERYSLSFDFDPVWLNGEEMRVLLDTPTVRNIYFEADGSVRLYPFGTVGTFDLNGVNQVETEVDFEADRWKLIVNGNVLYDGEFSPSSDDLRAIRFSMGALREVSGSVAAIDNIQVKGLSSSSATTPPPVAGNPDPAVAPPAATTP
ncbi:S8 family serine peptidase [Baaleninema sp.]|uniref:S8 family serine peptidase n=1 Tax=Baaleninema sp. TaxID=3101197 RepID=UPI003CFC95A8